MPDIKKEYDARFVGGKTKKELAMGIDLIYERFKGALVVQDRDFAFIIKHIFDFDKNTITELAISPK